MTIMLLLSLLLSTVTMFLLMNRDDFDDAEAM